ncbi:YIP1 family protein [Dongshaea marina]|uniref:YIP1 family protein n=1 Tax=Dongshaea marina TaxID=2047966 RepID=UPI00131F143D|nr:YIP1 family protein [Dongshaea marina]
MNDDLVKRACNPWLSIWIRPRATIREIVEHNPRKMVLCLAMVAGIAEALERSGDSNLGDRLALPWLLLVAIVGGAVLGVVVLYVGSWLLGWTGRWLGGQADQLALRAAHAWSSVPKIWALLLWIPSFALFGPIIFTSQPPEFSGEIWMSLAVLMIALIKLVIIVWAYIVFLKCLAEVQGFSAWKALGNAILASLVVVIPLGVISGLVIHFTA